MRILVVGGGVFVGRAVVGEARSAGHDVIIFNRGRSGPAPEGVEQVLGDRTVPADVRQLSGLEVDLVVDTCGYVPADVGLMLDVLEPTAAHYCFVSTVNVFRFWPERIDYQAAGVYAGGPDATREDVPGEIADGGAYGWLKSGCESAVLRRFGGERSSILRAGCIVGPDDSAVGRLPWWIDRVARGGDVLVPGRPDDPMSLIDARDLARFALTRRAGVFETPGPAGRDTIGELMGSAREVTGSDARFIYVDSDWLVARPVAPWTQLPLWAPGAPGVFRPDPGAAEAAGLRWRPLSETVTQTWAWQRALAGGWQPTAATPGLDPLVEHQLLAEWAA
ncbi:MAG: NAD-dependent epimerase/dehydratase family protein [Actinobacteria bacterium]|nr:NAD-dependent epimerase/dehydratase family protein [Actinomycetota bacterium]